MLRSIRKVFELLGIQPESIQFQKEEFNGQNVIDALRNEPQKCPVITAADFTDYFVSEGAPTSPHVMVTAGALKGSEFIPTNTRLANQWFIKCKNSYGNDPAQPGEIHQNITSVYSLYKAYVRDIACVRDSFFANKTYLNELRKDMFKIPLLNVNMKTFPDHGWRFGNPKAFYITIDDTDVIFKPGKKSFIYSYN